jgi:uncharacterized membrane protein YfhO
VRSARQAANVGEAIAVISRFDPRREVLVEDAGLAIRNYPGGFRAVDVTHLGDEIEIDFDAGEGGFLVLSEIAYPGWRVRDDGVPLAIHRANGIFQTVEVGPGRHSLRFEYLPRAFEVGRAISAVSIVLVLGLLGVGHRCGRSDRIPQA